MYFVISNDPPVKDSQRYLYKLCLMKNDRNILVILDKNFNTLNCGFSVKGFCVFMHKANP